VSNPPTNPAKKKTQPAAINGIPKRAPTPVNDSSMPIIIEKRPRIFPIALSKD
jgi:hypothetical protein